MSNKGTLGVFKDEESLKAACREMKARHFKKYDALTPFPVHGLEDAMGLKRSPIPWVTFFAGFTGGSLGLLLQAWTSAVDWPLNVGGKPFLSWPAFIPVTFELTILFGGLATAGALFAFCGLPRLGAKVHHEDFTNDKFGVFVPASESGYNADDIAQVFRKVGAVDVKVVGD